MTQKRMNQDALQAYRHYHGRKRPRRTCKHQVLERLQTTSYYLEFWHYVSFIVIGHVFEVSTKP